MNQVCNESTRHQLSTDPLKSEFPHRITKLEGIEDCFFHLQISHNDVLKKREKKEKKEEEKSKKKVASGYGCVPSSVEDKSPGFSSEDLQAWDKLEKNSSCGLVLSPG